MAYTGTPLVSLSVHDNKTASRLNDAWSQSFLLSHQITTYCAAATVFTQHAVHNAEVLGLALPLPKTYDFGGYVREVGQSSPVALRPLDRLARAYNTTGKTIQGQPV